MLKQNILLNFQITSVFHIIPNCILCYTFKRVCLRKVLPLGYEMDKVQNVR